MKNKKITVTIKQLPVDSFSYFQWLLLGLKELEEEGLLKLRYNISLFDRIALLWFNSKWIAGALRRIIYYINKVPRHNLIGEIECDGTKKTFTLDCKDSPYIYNVKLLKECDCYFKLHCPIEIEKEGFEIMPSVRVPYMDIEFADNEGDNAIFLRRVSPEVYELRDKILPAMGVPRRLAWSCRYKDMKKQYLRYLESQAVNKDKKLFAYFGSTSPVKGSGKNVFDMDWEPDVITFLKQFNSSHPNEKRAIAVHQMNELGDQYDGRLIHDLVNDNDVVHQDKVIPLEDFCDFIAQFEYNLNISGFRMSIPNRFVESFISGTAILTDKLRVKWYKPFEDEVVETVEMGYLPNGDVDWDTFKKDIMNLPKVDKEKILKAYNEKWSPIAFAKYVVNTTLGQ